MCFTETWLHGSIPDFTITRGGGERRGLVVFGNNRWRHPGHVTVKEHVCSSNTELLAVGLRPY